MTKIQDDDFSKLEYEGWQRVADQYNDHLKLAFEQGVEQFKVDEGYKLPFLGCIVAVEKSTK